MKINKQQVEHMASLAKLELSDAEKAKYAKEFTAILDYIDQLSEIDVEGVEPVIGGSVLENKLRADEITRAEGKEVRDKFIPLAPEHADEYIETISPLKDNK